MTFKTSSNKCSPVRNFFVFSLKKQMAPVILVSLFSLLICPGVLINAIFDSRSSYHTERFNMNDAAVVFSVIGLLISLAVMFFLCLLGYNFLYKKKATDFFHALPLTRNELLFTRFGAAFVGAVIPLTLTHLSLAVLALLPITTGVSVAIIAKAYLLSLLLLFMCTAFTLIFVVTAGGIFDLIVSLGTLTAGLPVIYLIGMSWLANHAVGVMENLEEASFLYTSPFLYALFLLGNSASIWVDHYNGRTVTTDGSAGLFSILGCIVFAALCLFAAAKLFKRRKSETAGEPYSFAYMPNLVWIIVSAVGGFLVGLIFSGFDSETGTFWVFFIVGALLCAVAIGAIMTRGFKRVRGSLIRGGIAIALMVALCLTMICVGSAVQVRIPNEKNIAKIQLHAPGGNTVEFTSDFDTVMAVHKLAVENIKQYGSATSTEDASPSDMLESLRYFQITYVLNSGRTQQRSYSLYSEEYDKLLFKIKQSEEYLSLYAIDPKATNISVERLQADDAYYYLNAAVNSSQVQQMLAAYKEEMRVADESVLDESCIRLEVSYMDENNRYDYLHVNIPASFTKTMEIVNVFPFETTEEYMDE